jgi:CRISPR-associated protein Cas2
MPLAAAGRIPRWPSAAGNPLRPGRAALRVPASFFDDCLEGYGSRVQYSVFVCDLSDRERILMRGDLEALMKLSEDSVMVVDLGVGGDSSRFLFLGQHERLPSVSAVIV